MILLDTNVISEIMRPRPEQCVVDWLDRQQSSSIWTTSISLYEVHYGLLIMPAGRRRSARIDLFRYWLNEVIQERIVQFDAVAAECAAELGAVRKEKGRPGEARDTMIAGIVLANHAKLATRNVRHFEDIAKSVVNPWEA